MENENRTEGFLWQLREQTELNNLFEVYNTEQNFGYTKFLIVSILQIKNTIPKILRMVFF
jgi:hypothetical protein